MTESPTPALSLATGASPEQTVNEGLTPSEERCAAHDLHRGGSWHEAGFLGLATRRWRATNEVSGWLVHHSGEEVVGSGYTWLTVEAGTRLRLDQTDAAQQGCTQGDFIVAQRFHVLDGAQVGRCIEFTQYAPEAYTAWVPDGLAAELEPVLPSNPGTQGRA